VVIIQEKDRKMKKRLEGRGKLFKFKNSKAKFKVWWIGFLVLAIVLCVPSYFVDPYIADLAFCSMMLSFACCISMWIDLTWVDSVYKEELNAIRLEYGFKVKK